MSGAGPTALLIDRLTQELRPVRRLSRPGWRAAWWLGLVLLGGAGLATRADLDAVMARLSTRPDMWLAVVGSAATAALAAIATMMVALPDRDARWAWLPVPAALLWLGASGAGCLRGDLLAGLHPASLAEAGEECLPFIVKVSVALAVPLAALLWRSRPLRPGLVCWTAGLALAAASASLLWLFHPFDAGAADLAVHVVAVGLVVGTSRLAARLLPSW